MTTVPATDGFWARAYRGWMVFAEGMRRTVAAVIFGTVYLTAGLVFAVVRRIFTRREPNAATFWRERAPRTPDVNFFRRMS